MFDLVPWTSTETNPFTMLDRFEQRLFNSFMNDFPQMRTDIIDKEDRYLVQAELPGFSKNDIHVEIKGNILHIHAEHSQESNESSEPYIHRERRYGSFCRQFNLEGIDQSGIHAEYKDGILELVLPKTKNAAKASSRNIPIL